MHHNIANLLQLGEILFKPNLFFDIALFQPDFFKGSKKRFDLATFTYLIFEPINIQSYNFITCELFKLHNILL